MIQKQLHNIITVFIDSGQTVEAIQSLYFVYDVYDK